MERNAEKPNAARCVLPQPTGYVWDRRFEMDPDLAVRQAIAIIFERFAAEPTANAVVRWGTGKDFERRRGVVSLMARAL
jgi:hypothetical protein